MISHMFRLIVLILILGTAAQAEDYSVVEWEAWNSTAPPNYPRDSWHRYQTPEDAGWSSAGLSNARQLSERAGSAAVMVIYDGAVLAQWGQTERRFRNHSVRKSLLSALFGIAVSKSEIDIESTIGSIGIDEIGGLTENEKSAKVVDLLKSRSGVYLPAAYQSRRDAELRPDRGIRLPDSNFYYNNWDFNALATVYNRVTGGDVFEAFEKEIAEPLQMQDFSLRHTYYHLEPDVSHHAAYPFRMSARDLARFGLLYLNQGNWSGSQIIPSDWVDDSTLPYSRAPRGGYGYMWWVETGPLKELGAFAAWGRGGQVVYVVPGARLVLVHRVDTYQEKSVADATIRRILIAVLNARTGPPTVAPVLEPIPTAPRADIGAVLSNQDIASLTGEYHAGSFVITVSEIDGQFEASSPLQGRFLLVPRSTTEFRMEDTELRVSFKTDGAGNATTMQLWFDPTNPTELSRVN